MSVTETTSPSSTLLAHQNLVFGIREAWRALLTLDAGRTALVGHLKDEAYRDIAELAHQKARELAQEWASDNLPDDAARYLSSALAMLTAVRSIAARLDADEMTGTAPLNRSEDIKAEISELQNALVCLIDDNWTKADAVYCAVGD